MHFCVCKSGVSQVFELGLIKAVVDTAASQETRNAHRHQLPFDFLDLCCCLRLSECELWQVHWPRMRADVKTLSPVCAWLGCGEVRAM